MIKFLLTFGTGVYCGIYVAQSHPNEVPVVANPQELATRVRQWFDEITKPKN